MKILLDDVSGNFDKWLALRKNTIGSSTIAAICGLGYDSALDVWARMTGKTPEQEDNDQMWLGRMLEPVVGDLFTKKTKIPLVRANCLIQHPEKEWATASPDFFVVKEQVERRQLSEMLSSIQGIFEAKTGKDRSKGRWEFGAPADYILQLNWQLGICGVPKGHIAGLLGNDADLFQPEEFDYSPEIFAACMERAEAFMELVRTDTMPLAGAGDTKLLERLQGKRQEMSVLLTDPEAPGFADEYQRLTKELALVKATEKRLQEERDGFKAKLLQMLGNATEGEIGDGRKVRAKTVSKNPYTVKATSYVDFRIS